MQLPVPLVPLLRKASCFGCTLHVALRKPSQGAASQTVAGADQGKRGLSAHLGQYLFRPKGSFQPFCDVRLPLAPLAPFAPFGPNLPMHWHPEAPCGTVKGVVAHCFSRGGCRHVLIVNFIELRHLPERGQGGLCRCTLCSVVFSFASCGSRASQDGFVVLLPQAGGSCRDLPLLPAAGRGRETPDVASPRAHALHRRCRTPGAQLEPHIGTLEMEIYC